MEEVDRISELPEPILHHILSLLPLKQVAQISILSKTWEKIWRTYPILEFDGTILKTTLCRLRAKGIRKRRKRLYNGLEDALRNRYCREMICMKRFTLDTDWFGDDDELAPFVDRCICYAVGSDVKELRLEFVHRNNKWFKLPQIVLRAGSMELLKLRSCLLVSPRSNMQLSSLRQLFLSHVFADDHMIATLVSSCPFIEDLGIHMCQGFKCLELCGLNRLSEVKVTDNSELQQLNVVAMHIHLLTIFWSSATCEINIASGQNIKTLSLNRIFMKDEWLCNLISRLPLLEFLSLFDCFELKSVKISSLCLKELCLGACGKLVVLNIDAPNLHVFSYSGDIIYLSLNIVALSKTDLELQDTGMVSRWFVKCIEFLAKFRQFSEVLSLRGTIENINVPRNLRIALPSPLSSLKHLNSRSRETHQITKAVDDLLWISPHAKTISIEYGHHNISSFEFQFLYKKQLIYEGEFASCCKCKPVSCWQQCMEEVELKIIVEDGENGNHVNSYTLKGADTVKQINALCGGADL